MRSDFLSRAAGLRSRLARAGVALLLSALLPAQAVVIAAPSSMGPQAPGASKAPATSPWTGPQFQTLSAEIDPAVLDAFDKSDQVSYLVLMRTRADFTSVAASARASASPAQAEVMARSAVISSLREAAETTQASLLSELEKAQGAGQVSHLKSYWIANMIAITSNKAVMEKIAKRHDVEKIYPNGEIHLVGGEKMRPEASDASASGSPEISTIEWNINRVGAPAVWEQFGIDGTGAVVASLDTGVQWTHEALQNQYRGFDPATGQIDSTYSWFDAVQGQADPYDDHGHGTHTTGTMVGRDPAGANEIGVAPGAKWIAAKILNAWGNGTTESILAAGQWVMAPGGDPSKAPDVVNNSWGGGPGMDDWFRGIVAAWRAAGIVPTFANGNDGPGPGSVASPANYPESIGVGATDSRDRLALFSSRGPSPYDEIKPELSSPGVGIRSSLPGGTYVKADGTSMAAPHVAGAVALLRQADASLTVDEIEEILLTSADPMTDSEYTSVPNNGYGHGMLNTLTAVNMVISGAGSVSGRVVTGGDDLTAPVITHTPMTEGFKQTDVPISAHVADDVSVTAVYLRFRLPGMRWWGIVDMEMTSGDHRNGMYTGVIPAEITSSDSLEYYLEAVDYGNNHAYHGTNRSPHVITLLNGITVGYLQDFEGPVYSWVTGGTPAGVWQFGEPTSGPNAAHSGTKVAATNLSGSYPSDASAFLISPPIDLTGGLAVLRFHHWYDFQENRDFAYVLVTADNGANWTTTHIFTGQNGSYEEVVIDLTPYAGNPRLFVAFALFSNQLNNRPGWYIDDVELSVDEEAPPAPTNLTAQSYGAGSISLAWDASSAADISYYTVYRSTDSGSGYEAIGEWANTSFVDVDTVPGTTYHYVVTASDAFANESGPSNEASATAANVTILFSDDMEGGPGAWTHSGANDPWEWGVPLYGPTHVPSGLNLWGTSLAGNYPNNANASLVTPPIDLSGLSSAMLQFSHWYQLERKWDVGRVEITTDGGSTWTQLAQYSSPLGTPPVGWETPLIDLSAYTGQTVQVRFRIISDVMINYPGWYIDDVRIAGMTTGGSVIDRSLSVEVGEPPMKDGAKPAPPNLSSITLPKSTATYRVEKGGASGVGIMSLPVDATVTVLESGRVVRTNPIDGSYRINLPAGTYTLRAEAYGYYPSERTVEITDGMETSANLVLEAIPRGLIHGRVTSGRNGEPIEGARVWVAEDPMVSIATTDANGHFTLDLLTGSYTLEVRHSTHYPTSMAVNVPANGSLSVDVEMVPFVGLPGEIGYDDGLAERPDALPEAGDGWAVRMSPERPNQTTFISAVRFFLWDPSWPNPGGNSFQAAIFAVDPDGSPGAMLAGPVKVTNAVRGAWNEVDFSAFGLTVTGDFYVAYIQDKPRPDTPGMGFDETSYNRRTWRLVSGSWNGWNLDNAMIRAVVSYGVGAPTITVPADGSFTNNPTVNVQGMGQLDSAVRIYLDGELVVETMPADDGSFSVPIAMEEGAHVITAAAIVPDSGTTAPSAPVHIVVDLTAPELTVASPVEGAMLGSRLITVSGQTSDANLDGVLVNGMAATVGEDGHFTVEIIGQEGANAINVVASDRAGNQTVVTRNVQVDSVAPVFSNLQPSRDHDLSPGDTLTVSFNSEPGLALAAFNILDGNAGNSSNGIVGSFNLEPGEMAMTEIRPGHYRATWTVPADISATAVYVRFRGVDSTGNAAHATAPGVLHISPGDGGGDDGGDDDGGDDDGGDDDGDGGAEPVTAVIVGPAEAKVRHLVTFDGTRSSSPKGIVSYQWDMGDGKKYSQATIQHVWRKLGTYTVTMTVTDSAGNSATTTMTVTVVR